jgi:hypothetical protein
MPDRLLHQGAQPGLEVVMVAFGWRALVFGASVPIGACQRARTFAIPRNAMRPRIDGGRGS